MAYKVVESKYKYFTMERCAGKWTEHKIIGDLTSHQVFVGYRLACGNTAISVGRGLYSLASNYHRNATLHIQVVDNPNTKLCPVCFPNGIEQD